MACFKPVSSFKLPDEVHKQPVFTYKRAMKLLGFKESVFGYIFPDGTRANPSDILAPFELSLPCSKCIGCRVQRALDWTIRATHELASYNGVGCFITLTYNDASFKKSCFNVRDLGFNGLNHRDFQLFFKRLRKFLGSDYRISYLMVGEYGGLYGRPHFHFCLFGYTFPDLKPFKSTNCGSIIYRSLLLESLWTHGYSSIGQLNSQSINYVARYTTKKSFMPTTKKVDAPDGVRYRMVFKNGESTNVIAEYIKASLRPALGRRWIEKYLSDVYNHDVMVFNGRKLRPPRYYDKVLEQLDPKRFELVKQVRKITMQKSLITNSHEYTAERLAVKEQLLTLRCQKFAREMKEHIEILQGESKNDKALLRYQGY